MAGTDSSRDASTRWIETSRGVLSYATLAPLLAERVVRVQGRIEVGEFAARALDESLLLDLHREFCGDLVPDWAGRWRSVAVQVGSHLPPAPHEVPLKMRDYLLDLQIRLEHADTLELLPESLAFAEGRLLTIHPFADFNGRLARLWLWELLRRLNLPPVELAPSQPAEVQGYLAALRAADGADFAPLTVVWQQRLEARANGVN